MSIRLLSPIWDLTNVPLIRIGTFPRGTRPILPIERLAAVPYKYSHDNHRCNYTVLRSGCSQAQTDPPHSSDSSVAVEAWRGQHDTRQVGIKP